MCPSTMLGTGDTAVNRVGKISAQWNLYCLQGRQYTNKCNIWCFTGQVLWRKIKKGGKEGWHGGAVARGCCCNFKGENLWDLGLDKEVIEMTPKAQSIKEKN